MYYIFPKFRPSKDHPPDSLQFVGRCSIEIGPHIFSNVPFYEASFTFPAQSSQAMDLVSLNAELTVLSHLFDEGRATEAQTERLAELLKQLTVAEPVQPSPERKVFEVIFKLPDDRKDRLLLPQSPAVLKRSKSGGDQNWDLVLRLPFDNPHDDDMILDDQSSLHSSDNDQRQPWYKAKLKLRDCPEAVSDLLHRWIDSEGQREEYQDALYYYMASSAVLLPRSLLT